MIKTARIFENFSVKINFMLLYCPEADILSQAAGCDDLIITVIYGNLCTGLEDNHWPLFQD